MARTDGAHKVNAPTHRPTKPVSALSSPAATPAPTPTPTQAASPMPSPVATPTNTLQGSVKAIDSANTITDPAWFTKAYADGFRLYVMQAVLWDSCTPWARTQPQLNMALDAGLKVAIYTRDPRCWQAGIQAAGPYANRLQFFALDVETGGVPVTREMVNGVSATGVRPIIYSGSGMWDGLQGATANSFSDVPLWDTDTSTFPFASWNPDYLAPAPVAYGGWNTSNTMRIASQQQFEFNYNGVAIDLNSFDGSFLTVP